MRLKDKIAEELAEIRATNGGLLRPPDVVEFAKDPETALHSQFEWDDSEAAHLYRISQAQRIIRMEVTVLVEDREPVRANVSLLTDRQHGLGYRRIEAVLSDDDLRQQLLIQALSELQALQRRYSHISHLAKVWREIDRVAKRSRQPEQRPAA